MKKIIVVFLMMCSTVQARQAVGLMMPRVKAASVTIHANDDDNINSQKPTTTERSTTTTHTQIDTHAYAVTNDAFAKIGLVEGR